MAEWVRFIPIDKGYYDPDTGQNLPSIEGRFNRPGTDDMVGGDRFEHKGKTYPAPFGGVTEREVEVNGEYFLKLNLLSSDIDRIINSHSVFQARRLTQEELDILEPPESCTTCPP